MMRGRLVRGIMLFLALAVVGLVLGSVLSKRLTKGDEGSDEFQIAAIFGGKNFHSRATGLRSGAVMAAMGGTELDLRDATLASDGANLELKATLGGVLVMVPEDWAVDVDVTTMAGGVEVNVTPSDDLPADAPRLHVDAASRLGGVLVTTKPT